MIIGLTGQKRAGKTTVAEYLASTHGFNRLNFKDALVAELIDTMPGVLLQLKDTYDMGIDQLFKEKPPIMRALMQNYGTELRRNEDENYWVKKWIESVNNTKENTVVDDVRFTNEAQAIRDKGGIIVRVIRDDIDDDDQHQSEQEQILIKADFTVYAKTGGQERLLQQIENVLSDIKAD